jgi:hypothetical protein
MQPHAEKPSALIKPTLETRYHIDYGWWERDREGGEDLRIYLLSHLLPEQRERLSQEAEGSVIDYIDPDTGEVSQLDELGVAVQIAARDPNFISPQTSLVDCIFRVFLANGNEPLTPVELSDRIGRPAITILKTLSGARVYKGIRPSQT